jgi:tRNA threonylcarbamoyladenosine modification (KEOPS) complex Cgi121 subunit
MVGKIHVAGYRCEVVDPAEFVARLMAESARAGSHVEAYDAAIVLGREHVTVAWERAKRSVDGGSAACDSVSMEARLFVSCERQIKAAIIKSGVKPGKGGIVLASESEAAMGAVAEALCLRRDDAILEPDGAKLSLWGITSSLESAADVIFERMSLLEVER